MLSRVSTTRHSDSNGPLVHRRLSDKMNAARRLAGGLRRDYSLGELEAATGRALKDGVRYAFYLGQPYRRGLSDTRPTIRAYREAYAALQDLPGLARGGQLGAAKGVVNRVAGAWAFYRRYCFVICGGVLVASAPLLAKGD